MNPDQIILAKKHSTAIRYSRKYARKEKAGNPGEQIFRWEIQPNAPVLSSVPGH